VIFYESRKLNEYEKEKQYVIHDLDLATNVHALKMWRNYLLRRRFVLMIGHFGVKYMFDQPWLNAIHAIWMAQINEFNFKIKHIKGKKNRVADAFNRSVQTIHLATTRMCESDIKQRIKILLQSDEHFNLVK
jgi:hypothetical protein